MLRKERVLTAIREIENWSPASWAQYPALQLPTYEDAAALAAQLRELRLRTEA